METPIFDFANEYAKKGTTRLHMPGHKGCGGLQVERLDITEIRGADSLYEADGIIAQSERNASALFETGMTCYSTEGSSHVIRAMLYLAMMRDREKNGKQEGRPVVLAARNAHRAFITAAALLDFDIEWLWAEEGGMTLCSTPVTEEMVQKKLSCMPKKPFAVYVTSPDYLGLRQPIRKLADVTHEAGAYLLVDNAHGAYQHFLPKPVHPMDLGADLCCDSAHKTLPVLTGGAYLHIAKGSVGEVGDMAKQALAMFGSTSPSYVIMESLDLANRYLAQGYRERLSECIKRVEQCKKALQGLGFTLYGEEPLKITVHTSLCGFTGMQAAEHLRACGLECEYADPDFIVFMFSTENSGQDYIRLQKAMEQLAICGEKTPVSPQEGTVHQWSLTPPTCVLSVREAVFSRTENVPVREAVGRIMAASVIHCPPAIAVVVSGERITGEAAAVMEYYGMDNVCVVKDEKTENDRGKKRE